MNPGSSGPLFQVEDDPALDLVRSQVRQRSPMTRAEGSSAPTRRDVHERVGGALLSSVNPGAPFKVTHAFDDATVESRSACKASTHRSCTTGRARRSRHLNVLLSSTRSTWSRTRSTDSPSPRPLPATVELSAGIHSRWPTKRALDRQGQAEPVQRRTNLEEALAFEVTKAICQLRDGDRSRPSGKCPLQPRRAAARS